MRNEKTLRGNNDAPQNFNKSIKRLFSEIKAYKKIMIIALILAVFGAIISIATPSRISTLTDEIGKGLVIDEKRIVELSTLIIKNQGQSEIVYKSHKISREDQRVFMSLMSEMNKEKDKTKLIPKLKKTPVSIQKALASKLNLSKIEKMSVILVVMYLLSSLFSYIQSLIIATVSNKFAIDLRKKIMLKTGKLGLRYYDQNTTGDILSRVTNDVDNIVQAISNSTTTLISSIVMILGAVIMMFYTNWILALSAILSSVFGFVFMVMTMKRSQKYFVAKQESLGAMNGYIEEIYSSLNVVKVYNGKEDANKVFEEHNEKVCDSNIKSQFLSNLMMPMMMFVGNFGYVVVCIIGAILAIEGSISFGVIVAFIMYVRLFHNPMAQLAQGMTFMQSVAASSERVFEFLDEEEMDEERTISKTLDKTKIKGDVEFKSVSFRYPGNKKDTIDNFSAKAKAGEKIAIVGPTGAGKTTMVNLLMKFYEIKDGDIKIDGVSLKDLKRANVRELFTMVLQDTWLFEGSVMDNIVYNQKGVSRARVEEVCKSIGLDHFIKTLPQGYDTVLNENESVSSGQKQLLTIARGIIKDSPLLILDEATSSVDARTEELVQNAMDKLSEGKTSFIIAHRLSTIKNADLILVMKDGNIIEQGTHEKLLAKNGFYNELYNSQFEL